MIGTLVLPNRYFARLAAKREGSPVGKSATVWFLQRASFNGFFKSRPRRVSAQG
jgi:hypothetical protein